MTLSCAAMWSLRARLSLASLVMVSARAAMATSSGCAWRQSVHAVDEAADRCLAGGLAALVVELEVGDDKEGGEDDGAGDGE